MNTINVFAGTSQSSPAVSLPVVSFPAVSFPEVSFERGASAADAVGGIRSVGQDMSLRARSSEELRFGAPLGVNEGIAIANIPLSDKSLVSSEGGALPLLTKNSQRVAGSPLSVKINSTVEYSASRFDSRAPIDRAQNLSRSLEGFQQIWESAHLQTELRIARLSRENRELLGAQISAQSLQRQAEFFGRTAEAIGETFRRLQQMGAN